MTRSSDTHKSKINVELCNVKLITEKYSTYKLENISYKYHAHNSALLVTFLKTSSLTENTTGMNI
jgi:hypothetical protein